MTLTKAKIGETVAEQIGYTKTQSVEMVEILLDIIRGTFESGEDVLVSGLGIFPQRCIDNRMEDSKKNYDAGLFCDI